MVLFLLLFLTGGPVEFSLEQKRVVSQAEGAVQLPQQIDQTGKKGNMKSEGRGLSHFWRRYQSCTDEQRQSWLHPSLCQRLILGSARLFSIILKDGDIFTVVKPKCPKAKKRDVILSCA